MAKVWLVTEGEYSDYCVVGAFSTEEKAQEYIGGCLAARGETYDDSYRIEEYELDSEESHKTYFWACIMGVKGDVQQTYHSYSRKQYKSYVEGGPSSPSCFYAKGNTKEAAIKICNEFRVAYLASHPEIVA